MLTKLPQNSMLKRALQIAGVLAALAAVYLLRRQLAAVLTPVLIALTVAYILNPVVLWLEPRFRNRTAAVLLIFLVFFSLLAAIIVGFFPLFSDEVRELVERVPQYIQRGQGLWARVYAFCARLNLPPSIPGALEKGFQGAEARLLASLGKIPEITINVAKGIFTISLVIVLSFYFLRDFTLVKESFYYLIPRRSRPRARTILQEVDNSLGKYVRGELLLALVVGLLSYISLLILGVEFSLVWGIFAGLTNTIPYLGPFLGGAPAVLMALLTSPALALKTTLVFILIQQVECHFISPYILGKSVGLHPLVVFLALLVGGQFFGIWGLVIAVPVVAAARIVIRNLSLPPLQ